MFGPSIGSSSTIGAAGSSNLGFVPASDFSNSSPGSDVMQKAVAEQAQPKLRDLVAHVRHRWSDAKLSKQLVEDIMIDNLRRRKQKYSPEKLQAIVAAGGGSDVFFDLTGAQCRALEALLIDIMAPMGDKVWSLKPNNRPNIPKGLRGKAMKTINEAIQSGMIKGTEDIIMVVDDIWRAYREEATKRAKRMEDVMDYQHTQGSFREALMSCIYDVVVLKGGILRCTIAEKEITDWENAPNSFTPVRRKSTLLDFTRISPFDIYPCSGVRNFQDGPFFHHHRLLPEDLSEMIGKPGNNDTAIRAILETPYQQSDSSGFHFWLWDTEEERRRLANRPYDWLQNDGHIDALQLWERLPGWMLKKHGVAGVSEDHKYYDAEIWVVNEFLVRAVINPHPDGIRGYFMSGVEQFNDEFWSGGLPEIIKGDQDIVNAAVRTAVTNSAISSGPMVGVNTERLPDNYEIPKHFQPWEIIPFINDLTGSGDDPIIFFQPNSNVGELIKVAQVFNDYAQDHSGVSFLSVGSSKGDGKGNSSNMAMALNSAAQIPRKVIFQFAMNVIKPIIRYQYMLNIMFHPDNSIKGDMNVIAKGPLEMIIRDMTLSRQMEFLQLTANPLDSEIVNLEGRAALLRSLAERLDLPADEIVPSAEKLAQYQARKAMVAEAQAKTAQEQQEIENEIRIFEAQSAMQTKQPDSGGQSGRPGPSIGPRSLAVRSAKTSVQGNPGGIRL